MSERIISTQALELIATAVGKSKTPEDAYKAFMAYVSKALAEVVADGLKQAAEITYLRVVSNESIAGWQKFITGAAAHVDFGAPVNDESIRKGVNWKDVLVTKLCCNANRLLELEGEDEGRGTAISISFSTTF